MARPRSFDPATTLDTVRDLFWAHGFHGTSYEAITAATGLTKPSLYAAYGDKETLFLRVLDRYQAQLLAHAERTFSAETDTRKAIRGWMISFLPALAGSGDGRGCLSVNTLVEGMAGREVLDCIALYMDALERLLRERLSAGIAAGEFPDDFAAGATAGALLAGYMGLLAMARRQPGLKATREVMMRLLEILETA